MLSTNKARAAYDTNYISNKTTHGIDAGFDMDILCRILYGIKKPQICWANAEILGHRKTFWMATAKGIEATTWPHTEASINNTLWKLDVAYKAHGNTLSEKHLFQANFLHGWNWRWHWRGHWHGDCNHIRCIWLVVRTPPGLRQ